MYKLCQIGPYECYFYVSHLDSKAASSKKKKKVGITRHLDMIPGTLLPEHLPSLLG